MYREHHPSAEPVENTLFMPDRKAGFYKEIFLIAVFKSFFCKCIPLFKAVSQFELFDGLLPESPFPDIGKSNVDALI